MKYTFAIMFAVGLVLTIIGTVIMAVACYGSPYTMGMAFRETPWYGWVFYIPGIVLCLVSGLLEGDR